MNFNGQVAVITGAGRGLGRSHALMLASKGCSVVVNDLGGSVSNGMVNDNGLRVGFKKGIQTLKPSSIVADQVVAEIKAAGGEATANYDSVLDGDKIVNFAVETYGRIDIVVCNAGIVRTKYFVDYDDEDWNKLIDVHLNGTYKIVRTAFRYFKKQKYGRVVMTSSSAGLYGQNLQAGYGAAKMAVVGLARVLSVEGKRFNINVNVIAPAAKTRMASGESLEVRKKRTNNDNNNKKKKNENKTKPNAKSEPIPLDQSVINQLSPRYVSALVTFLCHENCKESGTVYHAGGGWYGKVELIQSRGFVLDDAALKDANLATPESIEANFNQIKNLNDGDINGPGNQSLGRMLEDRLSKL